MLLLSLRRVYAFVLLVSVLCFTTNAASSDAGALDGLGQIPLCAVRYKPQRSNFLVTDHRTAAMYYGKRACHWLWAC
jgi:hypothetical protein